MWLSVPISYCAEKLEYFHQILIRALSVALILVVFGGVVCRYVLRIPVVWGEELAQFVFIWLAFLCASVAVRKKAHFRMSAILELLPARARAGIETVTLLLMGVLTVFLVWQGVLLAASGTGETAPGLQVPMTWVYAAVPFSTASMAIFLVEILLKRARSEGGA